MESKVFENNYKILAAPGLLFIAATIAGYRSYEFSEDTIHVTGLIKKFDVNVNDIRNQQKNTSYHRGNETVTWKLEMKDGKRITIMSEQVKDPGRFKEVLNWFLRNVPNKSE